MVTSSAVRSPKVEGGIKAHVLHVAGREIDPQESRLALLGPESQG